MAGYGFWAKDYAKALATPRTCGIGWQKRWGRPMQVPASPRFFEVCCQNGAREIPNWRRCSSTMLWITLSWARVFLSFRPQSTSIRQM